jgi:hypothetical protein
LEPIRIANEPATRSTSITAASHGMSSEPVNAVPCRDLEPDSARTLGLRVELPDVGDTVEELDDDVGGGVVDVGGGVVDVGGGVVDDEVGLGQLVRSVAASSEKYTWSTGRPSLIR